eukprot:jgi/Tetstr1/453306/TSEL_040298.t1
MSMETAVPIDFQEAWAEAQRCMNERVVAAVEADDPVVLDRASKWMYLQPPGGRAEAGGGSNKPWRGASTLSPSEMLNEYLRCLVGEYAPASRPAAVRAMSEVASMYLQVGEAERRAAERAVADNMKEAYVSVLAPSQLGVGISAGDSMLIHGVRLIAEKLGPLVDDRSAPLRSEDGVQQGAPLATTSFRVAIHPEMQQCDSTLEVTDGAARFNADDWWASRSTYIWPAFHAFRTAIKASVGLEVRFDKMRTYSADMEAACGPSRRRDPFALHHNALALLKHCMQHKAGYRLRNCLPSEVEAFAEAVDANVPAAVERVLGVSFDPSTYGTGTNPVVTDFLAELLHDSDPMAAKAATFSEDAVARARSRLHLATRLGPYLAEAASSARRYDHFLNDARGSGSYAAAVREAERTLFNHLDAASGMWSVAIPTARTVMTPRELREIAAGYFFLPSPCLAPVIGSQIILPST